MKQTEIVQSLVDFFTRVKCSFKIKMTNQPLTSNWDTMFIRPEKSYVEFGQTGPVRISEVEWVDINPIERIHIGARVPDKHADHTDIIKNHLDKNSINYKINDNIIRVIIADA